METLISSKVTLQTDGYTNVHTVVKCVLRLHNGGGECIHCIGLCG